MKNFLVLICLICIVSCKNETKKEQNNVKEEIRTPKEEYKEEFIVKLNVEYKNNDNIWLFYTEDYKEYSFDVKNVFQKSIKGQDGFQWVTFELPKGIFPERIKILFSNNKNQKSIKLKDMLITRAKNKVVIDSSNFENYFNFSKFILLDTDNVLSLLEIDGIYDPNIVSSSQLDNELVIL